MKDKFIELFKEVFEIDEDQDLNFTDAFRDFDEWDSLTHLSLIAMLDEEYDTQIEEKEFEKIETVEDLFNKLNDK